MATGPYYDDGLHVGQITRQGLTKASTGNKQFVLGVKILGLPMDDGTYAPHKMQYERTIYMTITEKTMPFVVENLKALDFTGTQFSQLDPSHINFVSLVGKQVDLWCKHELGNDNIVREKWQISRGAEAKPLEVLSNRELRELDSLFGKALKASKPAASRATAQADGDDGEPPSDPTDPGITDDDIPF
jgi:hypothetical protein